MPSPIYLVIIDAKTKEPLADRYVDTDKVQAWLVETAPPDARCDVYTAAPASGGHFVESLRRQKDGGWRPAAE